MARRQETDDELIKRLEAGANAQEPQPEPDPEPVPPPPAAKAPDPWEVMARVANALEVIASRGNAGQDSQAIEKLTTALERMTTAQADNTAKTIEESRKAFRPSNNVIPNVSVFNRRGELLEDYKKPPLKCLMMLPWLAEWESLTREEVELLNLLEAGSYIVKRADRSKITVTVDIRYKLDNITPSMLLVNHETAFNNDNFKNLPPLADMLRDMLKQHDRTIAHQAAAILTDEEEEALIEAGQLSVSA